MSEKQTQPAWVRCDCGEFWCSIHKTHTWECDCPPIDEWPVDPYTEQPNQPINHHESKP